MLRTTVYFIMNISNFYYGNNINDTKHIHSTIFIKINSRTNDINIFKSEDSP
jgi:hypothetical protein